MINTVIVEDELDAIEMLEELMSKTGKIKIIGVARTVEKAVNLIDTVKPDLILMDIRIIGGTGFDVLERIHHSCKIIFITAYDDFALKAIKNRAIDYLLKPVHPKEINVAIENAAVEINDQVILSGLKRHLIKEPTKEVTQLLFNDVEGIIRCKSESNYTRIFFLNKKPIIVSKTLKQLEVILSPIGFIRPHQSHLVNNRFIESVNLKNNLIYLRDKTEIPISRRRKSTFLEKKKLLGF